MAATLHCGEPRPAPYPDFKPRDVFFRDELGRAFRVTYAGGVTHAVAGSFLVSSNPFSLAAWTRCSDDEVSLEAVFTSCEPPTCPACAAIEDHADAVTGEHA